MSEARRNLAVGLTMLVALAMAAGMILIFAGLPVGLRGLFDDGYRVRIQTPDSAGAKAGDTIDLAGLQVGRVTAVHYTEAGNPARGVTLEAWIDRGVRIPAAATCHLSRQVMGGVRLELHVDPRAAQDAFLPTDGKAVIPGVPHAGGIGEQIAPALKKFEQVAINVNHLLTILLEDEPTRSAPGMAPAAGGLPGTLQRLHRTLDAAYATLDAENRANLRQTLGNLRDASARAVDALNSIKTVADDAGEVVAKAGQAADRVGELAQTARQRVDALGEKLVHDADRLAELLTSATQVIRELREPHGTAGKLLNDPKLYNTLLETTEQLRHVLQDVNALIRQWKKSGVKVDL